MEFCCITMWQYLTNLDCFKMNKFIILHTLCLQVTTSNLHIAMKHNNAYKLDINVSSLAQKYYVLLTKNLQDLEINFNQLPSCKKCLMIKLTKLNLITPNLIGIQTTVQHYLLKRRNSSLVEKGWNTKEQIFDELKQTLSERWKVVKFSQALPNTEKKVMKKD